MAETLGSLIDKLSIKNLRYWHLDESIAKENSSSPQTQELKIKLKLVDSQRKDLLNEIDAFLAAALTGDVKVCDEKVKLYRNTNVSSLENINKLGEAVSELAMSNTRIWHLEDEVRREDLLDSEVVKLKRNIDQNNQERCNLVDKVDEILQQATNQKN
jgi:hypothetical protein|tara:strand:+ start:509 stop:982 length:474 start_codon:yes stop_codon:yes gene_type:complete